MALNMSVFLCHHSQHFDSSAWGILELSLPSGDTVLSKLARKFITEVAAWSLMKLRVVIPDIYWFWKNVDKLIIYFFMAQATECSNCFRLTLYYGNDSDCGSFHQENHQSLEEVAKVLQRSTLSTYPITIRYSICFVDISNSIDLCFGGLRFLFSPSQHFRCF